MKYILREDQLKKIAAILEHTSQLPDTGLIVKGKTPVDNTRIGEFIANSDFYATWDASEGYWMFPEDPDSYDELEKELEEAFGTQNIDARFEGIF